MKLNAREKIIAAGVEMISLTGFNATGIDPILKAAGVPKGSFYHHFGTKENFGMEVVTLFAENYAQKLQSYLCNTTVSPLDRIRNYLEHGLEHLAETNFTKGCLIGNLGQELADQSDRIRERLAEIFNSWVKLFAACIEEAQSGGALDPEQSPEALAGFILSGWEGAILRAKVMRSAEPMRNFIDVLFKRVLTTG